MIQARATSAGTITNDAIVTRTEIDAFPANNAASVITSVQYPALSISSVSVAEKNIGISPAIFEVSLSLPAVTNVSVNFTTVDGTALAGIDYIATNGLLSFSPGEISKSLAVQIIGDTNSEPNEIFNVTLSGPMNAALAASIGTGTIVSDDLGAFFDDFEPGIDLTQWSSFGGTLGSTVLATNIGGKVSGVNSLWFGDAGTRSATSRPLDPSSGGSINFYLRFGNGSNPWETADLPAEGVVLGYLNQ